MVPREPSFIFGTTTGTRVAARGEQNPLILEIQPNSESNGNTAEIDNFSQFFMVPRFGSIVVQELPNSPDMRWIRRPGVLILTSPELPISLAGRERRVLRPTAHDRCWNPMPCERPLRRKAAESFWPTRTSCVGGVH